MPPPSGVNNIFSLLDEDDEADDGFTVVPSKAAKPAAKPAKVEEPKSQPQRERKAKSDRPPRGGKGEKRREGGYDGSDKPDKPADGENRSGKGDRRRDDGEGKGKGDRKKGKGGGRREFDRHSGTGRGKGAPREGHGKYNWGEKGEGSDAPGDGSSNAENEKPPRDENEAAAIVEEEEEENTMTFEEYMKAQADKKQVGKKFDVRKVHDTSEGFKVEREQADVGHADEMYGMAFHDYDGKKKGHDEKEARDGWVDADSVFNLKFVDPNAGGKGDRAGKGGKKGGSNRRDAERGGRGPRPSGGRPQQGKIELNDANAFPSLA